MNSCALKIEGYNEVSNKGDSTVPKTNPLSFDEVNRAIAYNAETGEFTWKIDAARNVKAGEKAGCGKGLRLNKKTGKLTRYIYIRFKDIETPAARIAWLLHHGEFPKGNLQFADGDTENLRISNLKETVWFKPSDDGQDLKVRKLNKTAARNYALKRYYGITGEQYGEMLAAQKGLCAVCGKPETAMFRGQPKIMHVDHCHETGKVRALLCGCCNGMLGLAKDDPATLRAAAAYIEKHAGKVATVTPLHVVKEPE